MEAANIKYVDFNDAQRRFSELLDYVSVGQEITITRRGSPVARLVPARPTSTPETRRQAIESMRELSERISLGGLKIKDLISEGRR
jgi:prevent-host-death family protein